MNEPSREDKAAAAKVRMSELAARFLVRTQADIVTLRQAIERLATGESAALGEIRHLAHRMVGTGATLGFEFISERAATLERLTESVTPGASADAGLRARLAAALDALDSELRQKHSS